MKVVLICLYRGLSPFVDELSFNLKKRGNEVIIFDMYSMFTIEFLGKHKVTHYHISNETIRKIFNIRYLGAGLRLFFYKWFLKKYPLNCDHISIHYVLPFYSYFIADFKKYTKSISICIWGSDFYRVNNRKRNSMKPLFNNCNHILIGNVKMASEFSSFYNDRYKEKILPVGFGIEKLEIIRDLLAASDKTAIKLSLNLPTDKLITTIGYNGNKAQQHLLILNSFKNLSLHLKKNIFIIIPFGYGGEKEYKNLLETKIKELDIEYVIYDNFISDIEISKIRISTDLVVNAQVSDASSASIQEHLYAENILLAGEWLPYDFFRNIGVKFWSFKKSDLGDKLLLILNGFKEYKKEVELNKEIIYNLSSWDARIDQWIDVCKNKYDFNNKL